jgi:hypothetical protein
VQVFKKSKIKPWAAGILPQAAVYGAAIPVIYGITKVSPLMIWANNLRKNPNQSKKATAKGGQAYVEDIDFLLGHNPITTVLNFWMNGARQYALVAKVNTQTGLSPFGSNVISFVDSDFYAIVGVSIVAPYSVTFNDYGSQLGSATYSGNYEIPFWNANHQGPDPVWQATLRRSPFIFRWLPGQGPTITLDWLSVAGTANFSWPAPFTIHIYYMANTPGHASPLGSFPGNTFESSLGNGSEYLFSPTQQIIYPYFAGVGILGADVGMSQTLPLFNYEVMGGFPLMINGADTPAAGDADFIDMIEDIFKSGPTQTAIGGSSGLGEIQHGLSCNNFPGIVQSKSYSEIFGNGGKLSFDLPNTKGNWLIGIITVGTAADLEISDAAGNSWTKVFPTGTSAVHQQVFYAQVAANTAANNLVTFAPINFAAWNIDMAILEVAGLDTIDQIITASGTGPATTAITTTNAAQNPEFLCNIILVPPSSADTALNTKAASHWFRNVTSALYLWVDGRLIRYPNIFQVSNDISHSSTWIQVIFAFKNSTPPSYPSLFPLGDILDDQVGGTLDVARKQCQANGLWGSLAMTSQRKASDWLTDIGKAANVAFVWSGFKLKVIPWSEVSSVGNGAIYNAPTGPGPIANLTIADFISGDASQPPITVERKAQVDSWPLQAITHPNRANDYDAVTSSQPEQSTVAIYGIRKDTPVQLDMVVREQVSQMLLGIFVRRLTQIRNTYKFKLNAKWSLLEPMDLITLPINALMPFPVEAQANVPTVPVRITSVQESDTFELDCEAEPFIYGVHDPRGGNQGTVEYTQTTPNQPSTAIPAAVNTPIFIEPVSRLTQNPTMPQLWIAVSDSDPNYGGCFVYVSTDGANSYNQIGPPIIGSAITGVLTSNWPAHADEDTTNDLALDLTESIGVLASYQVADEDAFTYPCYVAGGNATIPYELMTYAVATLTATSKYTLKATGGGTNHLRRAVFGAPAVSNGVLHSTPGRFCFLGPLSLGEVSQGILKLNMDPNWIGKTLHFKFVQFSQNRFGTASLTAVTDYPYTPTGTVGSTSSQNVLQYTISPASPLSQTTATNIAMAQTTATFPSNQTVYNARNFTIADPGAGNTQIYYVTIYDPGYVGDTPGATNLTSFIGTTLASVNYLQPGYIYMGSVVANHTATNNTVNPGGQPAPTSNAFVQLSINPANPGNFTVAHGLGHTPIVVDIAMTSAGAIWLQSPTPFDATNLYLVASDAGLTARVFLL